MQITIKGYITSKESELFSDCADRYAYNKHHHKFSISDGVSKSFFPKFWAEYLVDEFVSKEIIEDNIFLQECQEKWLKKVTDIVNKPTSKWFTQNAFNNKSPALATFVGLQFFEKEKKWEASALGDSFLFFVPKERKTFDNNCIIVSSKIEPIIFDNFPDYFSSIGDKFKGKVKQTLKRDLKDGTFYLMTDALAEWFLNEKENAIGKISVWQNQNDFERFIDEERLTEKLGNDDSAILIINVEKVNESEIKYSEKNAVSDIYELIDKQEEEIKKQEEVVYETKVKEELKSEIPENTTTKNIEEIEATSENENIETSEEKSENKTLEQTQNNLETEKEINLVKKESKGVISNIKDGLKNIISDTETKKEELLKANKKNSKSITDKF
ncbi:hypothetical protein [Tenacibaculum dicentrarchi]|uniref:hypothetical protein n=1 Tax=Tenacibaculum dicentrarchi TaxID=669041 RepID=UPI003516A9CB